MSEIILCPHCERPLRLPADFKADLARCPSCKTTFSVASASAAPPSVRSRARSVQRLSRNPCLIVALVVGSVFLIMGVGLASLVVIVWRMQPTQTNPIVPMAFDEEELREQARQAFKDRKPATEDEIAQQVKPLLDGLGAALRSGIPPPITAFFDQDRLVDELAAADGGALPLHNPKDRRDFRSGMGLGLAMSLTQHNHIFQWDQTAIRRVKKLNNDEAVVIARHTHANGLSLKLRWWVTRRNGDWQIYDYENLDTAWRLSAELVLFMGQGLGRMMEIGPALRTITEAEHAVALDDADGAEKKLAQVQGVQLPPRFESLRQMVKSMVLLHRGKYADALKAMDEAQRLHPDLPLADFLRGVALNQLGKPDQALKHLRAYCDLLGEDEDLCREIAEALNAQGRFAEAIKEYRKALDLSPKDERAFASLAQLYSRSKDIKQLQALVDTRRKDKPDDPSVVSWELDLRWLKHDYEGALRLLTEHREDVFSQPMFRWKADEYRVRCLVKLKRCEDAIRAAEKIVKKDSGDRLLLVFAYAAAGDVPQTIAAMEEGVKDAHSVQRFYQDDQLGPILKSKEFHAFRAKFPEPKQDKAAGGK